jgi:hypothetical protein
VVHGGALAALDWSLGGARAAGDGGQQGRRRSGESSSSEEGNCYGLGRSGK